MEKKKKINKVTVTLNDTLDQIKLIDNFKTLCPTQQKSLFKCTWNIVQD